MTRLRKNFAPKGQENEGQPLCHNAEFQKNSFSMIHVGCAFVQCAWSYLQQWFQTFLHAKDRLLNIFGSLACAPTRSYTNKLARPDLGHAQASAVSSQRSLSALGSWKVWKGAGGFTWPPIAASLVKSRSESTHSPHPAEGEAAKVPGGQGWADQSTNKHQAYQPRWAHTWPYLYMCVLKWKLKLFKLSTENKEHSILCHLLSQSEGIFLSRIKRFSMVSIKRGFAKTWYASYPGFCTHTQNKSLPLHD